ncbi:hypothetical protein D3C80_1532640 [compost metagenome]
MAFTRHQDHILFLGLHDGAGYRFRTTVDHQSASGVQQAGKDIGDNRLRLFGTRVVIGHYYAIGELFGDAAHQRAFAFVTIAAAAKHTPQLPQAVQTCGFQCFFQRVRGVGVINHYRRFTRRVEHFHAAADRLQLIAGGNQFGQRVTQRQQRRQCQQQIADVEGSHQTAFNLAVAPA